MANLQQFQAKICYTAAGILIHDRKILLVQHKKLGIWLAPGGHMEENELPHCAAEREFFEEAGIKVRAISEHLPDTNETEKLPNPFLTDLHWVSEENYKKRLASSTPEKRVESQKWSRGCEQHICFLYMVEARDSVVYTISSESTNIGWFSEPEIDELKTLKNIKEEIHMAFSISKKDKQ